MTNPKTTDAFVSKKRQALNHKEQFDLKKVFRAYYTPPPYFTVIRVQTTIHYGFTIYLKQTASSQKATIRKSNRKRDLGRKTGGYDRGMEHQTGARGAQQERCPQ